MPAIMAETASYLAKRQRCDRIINGQCYNYEYSRWNDWGRWVALAIIVIGILVIAFLFSCINNRRRRRRGLNPMYGTGWVPAPAYKPPQPGQQGHYGGAAPPYSPPINNQPTGNTFNSNDGYYGQQQYGQQQYGGNPYGGQQSGVELQTPQHSYQPQQGYGNRDVGGENVYAAPPGAPPGKGDGIIR